MKRVAPRRTYPSGMKDPVKSHFDDLLVRRVSNVIDAIGAARSSIRKCRQERIEAYLVRRDLHSSVYRLRDQIARARSLAFQPRGE